jgi:hypothetical protein
LDGSRSVHGRGGLRGARAVQRRVVHQLVTDRRQVAKDPRAPRRSR